MSCGMCPQIVWYPVHREVDLESHVERRTTAETVIGVDGKEYPLGQPLVPVDHFPRGDWGAVVRINGVASFVQKPTAIETFNEAFRLFQLNQSEFWYMNIWLNLNLQWIARVPEEHRIVTLEQLEAISTPVTP